MEFIMLTESAGLHSWPNLGKFTHYSWASFVFSLLLELQWHGYWIICFSPLRLCSHFSLYFFFAFYSDNIMEKAMAPHSSTLAWKIPWMEEPGGLQSMGSLRVGHDWATTLLLCIFMRWRRKWQPTPVFLPGESQGWGSLVGCRLWGRTQSDTTEVT